MAPKKRTTRVKTSENNKPQPPHIYVNNAQLKEWIDQGELLAAFLAARVALNGCNTHVKSGFGHDARLRVRIEEIRTFAEPPDRDVKGSLRASSRNTQNEQQQQNKRQKHWQGLYCRDWACRDKLSDPFTLLLIDILRLFLAIVNIMDERKGQVGGRSDLRIVPDCLRFPLKVFLRLARSSLNRQCGHFKYRLILGVHCGTVHSYDQFGALNERVVELRKLKELSD
ncbi:hypothetical protein Tco_1173636 [Tanacetum coccineum]